LRKGLRKAFYPPAKIVGNDSDDFTLGAMERPGPEFDINKPYGPDWKRKLGIAFSTIMNTMSVVVQTTLFVLALAVLWGWYVVGTVSCVMLVARSIDRQVRLKQLSRRQTSLRKSERVALAYFFWLEAIAVCVNLTFVVLYLLGDWRPIWRLPY
jgi:hypothetical protein